MSTNVSTLVEIELAVRSPLPSSVSSLRVYDTDEYMDAKALPSSAGTSGMQTPATLDMDFEEHPSTERNVSELAPVDGGFGAWSFVSLFSTHSLMGYHS